jgi:hypothetical protein
MINFLIKSVPGYLRPIIILQSIIILGEFRIVKYLYENILATNDDTQLHRYTTAAIMSNHCKIYRYLVSKGVPSGSNTTSAIISHIINTNRLNVLPDLVKAGYVFSSGNMNAAINNVNLRAIEIIMNSRPEEAILNNAVRYILYHNRNSICLKFIIQHKNIKIDWADQLTFALFRKSVQGCIELVHTCPPEIITYHHIQWAIRNDMINVVNMISSICPDLF